MATDLMTALDAERGMLPPSLRRSRTVDIISMGSMTRPQYLESQSKTWATHSSIRSFVGITEMDDYDQTCSDITPAEHDAYIRSCKNNPSLSTSMQELANMHYGHTEGDTIDSFIFRDDPKWHCAQRRFGQSYKIFMNTIRLLRESLPDYLVVLDDDTYFNVDLFQDYIASSDPNEARIYSGCLFEANYTNNMTLEFPYGGFGVVYSKETMKQMNTPIWCKTDHTTSSLRHSSFVRSACHAIEQNQIGERDFFRDGMSIVDLVHAYSAQVKSLCLHSDWLIGYVAKNYLDLSLPDGKESNATTFHPIKTWPLQCGNYTQAEPCSATESMFCHRQTPQDMEAMTKENQLLHPENYKYAKSQKNDAYSNIDRIISATVQNH